MRDPEGPIVVVDYDPTWPAVFESIRQELSALLIDVPVISIEHVGSTSVSGLAAKPVIDVDVVVARGDVDAAVAALVGGGYEHLGEMGIPDRHAFDEPTPPKRNVYVTVEGCLSLRNHVGVRDVLRSDEALREEYSAIKRQLAARYRRRELELYIEGKSAVIQRILTKACIGQDELASIEDDNRAMSAAIDDELRRST